MWIWTISPGFRSKQTNRISGTSGLRRPAHREDHQMTIRWTRWTFVAAAVAILALSIPAHAQIEAGDHIAAHIDTPQGYKGAAFEDAVGWSYELYHPDATYIAIHFVEFDLAPGDFLVVSDPSGDQIYTMEGKGKMNAGTFWARHIKGDTVRLELVQNNPEGGGGFVIDEYVAGFLDIGGDLRAICGTDDKENAICYATSHPTEYERGRAVARLLSNGSGFCTGWLVSAQNHIMTNEHCVSSASEALNTDFDFMAEAPTCGTPNCDDCFPGTIFSGGIFIKDSANLDYCLMQVASGNPASQFGWLEIDNRAAVVGEEIYIIGHPGGRAKEMSIFSTDSHDPGGIPVVDSLSEPPCAGSGYNDVGYYADTEGGSSGSPVLARSSHKVIALHHCADCPNRGVPINLIFPEIEQYLYPGPAGVIALDKDFYSCSDIVSIEMRDGDVGATGSQVVTATTSGGDSESVTLFETGADTAIFEGSVNTTTGVVVTGDGVVQVADGQTLTVTYIDANDGSGGVNVNVTDDALVDCVAPVINSVQATNIQPRSATVAIGANEPVQGTVHYGLSCGSLTNTSTGGGYSTSASVAVTGLQDNVTYFYTVEAADEAGNASTADNGGACYTFTTPEVPDYFTELFASGNDLDNISLFFEPNGTFEFYDACAEEISSLPTDPAGGTTLSLTDDGSASVNLTGGATVSLYGASFSTMYVNANGNITFSSSDGDTSESLEDHFEQHRISGVFDDLNPESAGSVSWKQLADRVAVTWLNVPEYNTTNSNTFQIEIHFDGTIVLSYLQVAADDGLAGLSKGTGLPADYYPSDLSALGDCHPKPPIAHGVQISTAVDVATTITLNAVDDGLPEPATVNYVITSLPANGSLSDPGAGAISSVPYTVANQGDEVDYMPDAGFHAVDAFDYLANDTGTPPYGGDSQEAEVTIVVGGPDWDPVAYNLSTSTAVDTGRDITLSASDPNSDTLTYVIESLPVLGSLSDPNGGAIGAAPYTLTAGGNIVHYEPPAGPNAPDAFTFAAEDATSESNAATVTVTIGGPDWDPVAYDVTDSTAISLAKTVSLNGWDPNGDPLSYVIESLPSSGYLADPAAGAIDSVPYELIGSGNEVMYQPECGLVLDDSFTYSTHDATAGSNIATIGVSATAADPRVVFDFPMNTDPGWSTEGEWAFGQPTGGGTHDFDPISGYTGVNVYGYNLSGDYGRAKPVYSLTTPAFDCTNLTGVELRFQRWLGVEQYDEAKVQVSVNGVDWTTVWDNPSDENVSDSAWHAQAFDLSSIADGESAMRIRWTMGPTDSSVTFPGWNIDDVQIWAIVPPMPADFNGDGTVKVDDYSLFSDCLNGPQVGTVVPCICVDLDADGDVDLADFAELQFQFVQP